MATKKEVRAIVEAAEANRQAAVAAGVRNPAPYGLVELRMLRDVQTERFRLAAGETWSPQFGAFDLADGTVEIGRSPIPFKRFEVVGVAHEFKRGRA